jgi:hypothetical protein
MRFFKKRHRAVKNWHSRAMVIVLSRTRVTFENSTYSASALTNDVTDDELLDQGTPVKILNATEAPGQNPLSNARDENDLSPIDVQVEKNEN